MQSNITPRSSLVKSGPSAASHRPTDDKDTKQDRNALLQTHLAEYQAITMRNTYWLTLQYALFPILGAAVAVLAQMWNQFDKDPAPPWTTAGSQVSLPSRPPR